MLGLVEETHLTSVLLSEDRYRKWGERSSSKDVKVQKSFFLATKKRLEEPGCANRHSRGTKAAPSRSHSRNFTPPPYNLLSCILFPLFSLEWHFVETLSHLAANRSPETATLLQNWQGPCCGIFQKLQGSETDKQPPHPHLKMYFNRKEMKIKNNS